MEVITPEAFSGLGVLATSVRSPLVVGVPVVEITLEAPLEVGSPIGSVGIPSSGVPASSVSTGLGSVRGLGPWIFDRFGGPELEGACLVSSLRTGYPFLTEFVTLIDSGSWSSDF